MFLLLFFLTCLADLVPFEKFNENFVACQINNCTGECRPTRFVKRKLENEEVILSAIPNSDEMVATRTTQEKSCELLENSACSAETFVSVQMDFCFENNDISTCQLGCGNVCESYYESRHYHEIWLNTYVQTCFLFCCLPEISGECTKAPCNIGETAYSSLVDLGCTGEMEAYPVLCKETKHSWEMILASGVLSSVAAIIFGILFARFISRAERVKKIELEMNNKKREEMRKPRRPPPSIEMQKMTTMKEKNKYPSTRKDQHPQSPPPASEKNRKKKHKNTITPTPSSSKRRHPHHPRQDTREIYPTYHTPHQQQHPVPYHTQQYPYQQYTTQQPYQQYHTHIRSPPQENSNNLYSPNMYYLHRCEKIPDPYHMPHWDNWLSFFIAVHRQLNKNARDSGEINFARELRNHLKDKLARELRKQNCHHLLRRSPQIAERLKKVLGGREKLTFEFLKTTLELFSSFLNYNLYLFGDFGEPVDYCRINNKRKKIYIVCLQGPETKEVFVSVRNQNYISPEYLRDADLQPCEIGARVWFKNQPARISAFKQRGDRYQFDALIEVQKQNQTRKYQFVNPRKLKQRQFDTLY